MGVCTTNDKKRFHLTGIKNGINKNEIPKVEPPVPKEPINNASKSPNNSQNPSVVKKISEIPEEPGDENSKDLKDFINGKEITRQPEIGKNDENNKEDNNNGINGNSIYNNSKNESQPKNSRNENNENNDIYQANARNETTINENNLDIKDNTNLNQESLNINYEVLDINKDYYLICPTCNYYITSVESVEYDSDKNDFKFKYKCFCDEVKENYLHLIIKDEKPICNNHKEEIKYICQDCSTQICEQCKNDNHAIHNIKNIIGNEVIPEQIMTDISDKKDSFKGFPIFEKIFYFYKNSSGTTKLPDSKNEDSEKKSEENPIRNRNAIMSEVNPEIGENEEEKVNNMEKNSNDFNNNNSEKKENDLSQNKSPKESQKKPENNDDLNNIISENINVPEEQVKEDELDIPKITNKSGEKENNIDDNLKNTLNENNINSNLNNTQNENDINGNEINNNDKINNAGTGINMKASLNNIMNEYNIKDNPNNIESNIKGEMNSDINLEQIPKIDDSHLKNEKPEIRVPNDFVNNQDNGRIEYKNISTEYEKEPEIFDRNNIKNINLENTETNPFKNNNNLNVPKQEENNVNINPENNANYELNNNIENGIKNNINENMNNNMNENMNNKMNEDLNNNMNENMNNNMNEDLNDNKNENFPIINNDDIGNNNLVSSSIKVANDENDANVGGNINTDVNNNLKNINIPNDLEDNNNNDNNNTGINDNNNNNFFDSIKFNKFKALKNYENTKTLIGHEDRIVSIIKLDSGYIATGSYDMTVRIWDITKDPKEALISKKCSVGFMLCLLELKPNELLAGNSENCIDVFNLADINSIDPDYRLFGHSLWITALIKCDEDHFASASNDAKIFIWDSNKKNKLKELLGHTDCILTMILLENGNLCSGSADNTIRIWDWKNEKCLSYFKAHNNWVKVIYQFNSQVLLSGSDDKKIKIWNTNLDLLGEIKGHEHSVRTFCKIDDNYFASGSFDNTIKIWDFKEQKCVNTLKEHVSNVICIINYDGKLISCSNDRTIKIWEEKSFD